MNLNIVGVCEAHTGYGDIVRHLCRGLNKRGIFFTVRPVGPIAEPFGSKLDRLIKQAIVRQPQPDPIELMICPPHRSPTPGKRTIYFTMWETDRLPEPSVYYLNLAELIIVPSAWNAQVFKDSGVTRPITVVNLGVDTETFQPLKSKPTGYPVVFGAAGRLAHGGVRKGVSQVISIFEHCVAPYFDPGVCRLNVKAFPDCKLPDVTHPAVVIQREWLDDQQLASWFHQIDVFVAPTTGEGWGLMQIEAMATGVPVITPIHSGLTEFCMDGVNCHAVRWDLTDPPRDSFFYKKGQWCRPNIDEVMSIMTAMVDDGNRGYDPHSVSESVRHLTWDRMVVGILDQVKGLL